MLDAYAEIHGIDPEEVDLSNESVRSLMEEAWNDAKGSHFYTDGL
jgi:hypothetical protein